MAGSVGTRPTDFLLDCPEEFRPILQTFTAKALHDAYPQVSGLASSSIYLALIVMLPGFHFTGDNPVIKCTGTSQRSQTAP